MDDNKKLGSDNQKVISDNPNGLISDNFTTPITPNMKAIMKAIASGKTKVQTITNKIGGKRGNVHRTLQTLIKLKFVEKEESTTSYFLTIKGSQNLLRFLSDLPENQVITKSSTRYTSDNTTDNKNGTIPTKKARSEKLSLVCKIKNAPKDWNRKRQTILTHKHIEFSTANLKNHNIYSHTLMGLTIKNTRTSIIINFPEAETYCAQQAFINVMDTLNKIQSKIERFYGITLSGEFQVVSQEHADLKTDFAAISDCYDVGNYYIFFDPIDKKPRWKIDKSKGFKEWETMHREMGAEDYDNINLRMADMADHHEDMPMPFDQWAKVEQQGFEINDVLNVVKAMGKQNLETATGLNTVVQIIKNSLPGDNKEQTTPDNFQGVPDYVR